MRHISQMAFVCLTPRVAAGLERSGKKVASIACMRKLIAALNTLLENEERWREKI